MNVAHFLGEIVRKPELRYSISGSAICKSIIMTKNDFISDGEVKTEIMYMDIVFFNANAEYANENLKNKSKVQISGRITFLESVKKHELVVEKMEIIK